MKKCKHVNENGYCTIGASSCGQCTLPCSHLEYDWHKFESLNVTDLFECHNEQYMKISNITAINSEDFGYAINLKNGVVYVFPQYSEVILLDKESEKKTEESYLDLLVKLKEAVESDSIPQEDKTVVLYLISQLQLKLQKYSY